MEQKNSKNLKVGDKFKTFYGNGKEIGISVEIIKLSDKSVFWLNNEGIKSNETFNTVNKGIDSGIYKTII